MRLYGTAILALAILGQASASLTWYSSSAPLAATDYIDWASVGGDLSSVAMPYTGLTNNGQNYQVNAAGPGELFTQDSSWYGSFAPGERILMPNYLAPGDMSITFGGSQEVVGTEIQEDYYGDYDVTMSVYNNFDLLLGSTTVHANSSYQTSNPYIGVKSSDSDIAKMVISTTNDGIGFGIGRVDAGQCGAVPEPASMAVLGLGVVGVIRRRRKA